MSKTRPLDDLEMFDLLQAAYPEKFPYDEDSSEETFNEAMEFVEEMSGFDEIADLLGRVVMLTMPMSGSLSGNSYHCLGQIIGEGPTLGMTACVKRSAGRQS